MTHRKKITLNDNLRREYKDLFAAAAIRREKLGVIDRTINRILDNRARYDAISTQTSVPWYFIAALHNMECNGNFSKHLHNGDPLTGRTVREPAGRPPPPSQPPFAWHDSAVDALQCKDLHKVTTWALADIAYHAERYNGFGYRLYHPEVQSPYLWSFTSLYTAGKYVSDGKFDPQAVSDQVGVMALLKRMLERGIITAPVGAELSSTAGLADISPGEQVSADVAPSPDAAPTPPASQVPPYPGRAIRRGDTGPHVEAVQRRLLELGLHGVGSADGQFGPRTEEAVKLFQARAATPSGAPLAVDGVVGPQTWRALYGQGGVASPAAGVVAASDLAREVIRIAEGELGVRETPGQPNRGDRVDQYLGRVGLKGEPWCVAFLYWCFDEAARSLKRANPMVKTASVWDHWDTARKRSGTLVVPAAEAWADPSLIQPGMIFHFDTGGRKGHAGLVTDVLENGRIATVEGNTDGSGGRDGNGVYRRERNIR
ncbi:MAG: peptidoglycan-binding protein, partial [Planctomycetota bacterium]|nr:peptidoglycan-binding protein [Planctomycetota bacterium]